jgi:hypothetical protein
MRFINSNHPRFTCVILSALICSTVGAGPFALDGAAFSLCCLPAVIVSEICFVFSCSLLIYLTQKSDEKSRQKIQTNKRQPKRSQIQLPVLSCVFFTFTPHCDCAPAAHLLRKGNVCVIYGRQLEAQKSRYWTGCRELCWQTHGPVYN